jgi:hypothetical protein
MQVISLLTKKEVALPKDAPITKWYYLGFNNRPVKDRVIDVYIIHEINWKRLPAAFILRIATCVEVTDPGAWLVVFIGGIAGLFTAMAGYVDMDIHQTTLPFLSTIIHCGTRVIELILLGWSILYGSWEFIQGWKWLTNWASKVKSNKNYN